MIMTLDVMKQWYTEAKDLADYFAKTIDWHLMISLKRDSFPWSILASASSIKKDF